MALFYNPLGHIQAVGPEGALAGTAIQAGAGKAVDTVTNGAVSALEDACCGLIDDHDANVSYASVRAYVAKRRATPPATDKVD